MQGESKMKYIRTKDAIFELMFPNEEQQMSFDHKTIEPAYYTINTDWIAKKDVIKQADTIEELCDEYILHDTKNHVYLPICIYGDSYMFKYDDGDYTETTKIKNYDEIYGAIWTDKGLIYVAKMNKEGDLELL